MMCVNDVKITKDVDGNTRYKNPLSFWIFPKAVRNILVLSKDVLANTR